MTTSECDASSFASVRSFNSLEFAAPAYVEELPEELLRCIVLEAFDALVEEEEGQGGCGVGGVGGAVRFLARLMCVSKRWHRMLRSDVVWARATRRALVALPLVCLVEDQQRHGSRATRTDQPPTEDGRSSDATSLTLSVPTYSLVRRVCVKAARYRASKEYVKYVQRRRSFVLHFFLSCMLLFFTLALASTLCAAEGLSASPVCSASAAFRFLWMAYLSIVAIVISNVVMQAHFEPQPVVLRLRNNKSLIAASAAIILLGVLDVMLPTALMELNLRRRERFAWAWCGATVILTLLAWQAYALLCIFPEARRHIRQQRLAVSPRSGALFLLANVPNAAPFFLALACVSMLQYIENGSRFFILFSGVPVAAVLGILSLVFLLDFASRGQAKDLLIGVCLFSALLFPASLLVRDFRGWCLAPLALSALGFFLFHAIFVTAEALLDLLRHPGKTASN